MAPEPGDTVTINWAPQPNTFVVDRIIKPQPGPNYSVWLKGWGPANIFWDGEKWAAR